LEAIWLKNLRMKGFWVKGVDLKYPEFEDTMADKFIIGDLTDPIIVNNVIDCDYDELYQFSADMRGAGYVFTGKNDSNVMHSSASIDLNTVHECMRKKVKKNFILHQYVCIQHIIRKTPEIKSVMKIQHTQQCLIVSMDWKNCLMKDISIKNIYGNEFKNKYGFPFPIGVIGRNSDNKIIKEKLNWSPPQPLREGMEKTFKWIEYEYNI
jgi:hypothetical protein